MGWYEDWLKEGTPSSSGRLTPPPEPEQEDDSLSWLKVPDFVEKATSIATWPGRKLQEFAGAGLGQLTRTGDKRSMAEQVGEYLTPTGQEGEKPWLETALGVVGRMNPLMAPLQAPQALHLLGKVAPGAQEYAAKALRPIYTTGQQAGSDPLMFGALGALNALPGGAVLHKALGVAFAGEMGIGAVHAAKRTVDMLKRDGITPDTVEAGMEALVSAGFAYTGLKGLASMGPKKPLRPDVAEAVEGAKADNADVNPYTAMLAKFEAKPAEGILPEPGARFQDVRLPDSSPLPLEAGKVLHDLANKTLAVANQTLASGQLKSEGGQLGEPAPSPIQRVVILDRNEVPGPDGTPTPIEGNAAQIGDAIYITRRGAMSILQARDAAGMQARLGELLAHEVGHPQGQQMPQVTRGPMGEPLPQGAQPREAGHAPGGLWDDSVADLNQGMLEHSLRSALAAHPGLNAEVARLQAEGGIARFLQPPTDLSTTAGTYQPDVLRLAAELQERPLPNSMEAAMTPEERMAPQPQVVQSGAARRPMMDALREIKQKVQEEQPAQDAVWRNPSDPRIQTALLADQARQAAERMAPLPPAQSIGDKIRAIFRPGKMTFDPTPASAALRGEKGPAPKQRGSIPQQVEPTGHLQRVLTPRRYRNEAVNKSIDWFKAADEAIAIGNEIKGHPNPVELWRQRGFEVADLVELKDKFEDALKKIRNNLAVAKHGAKQRGELLDDYAEVESKLAELRKAVIPRMRGENKRYVDLLMGRSTERAGHAQGMMQTKRSKRQLSSLERRVAKSQGMEAAPDKATYPTAHKAFRELLAEQVKAMKLGDMQRLELLVKETSKLQDQLMGEISKLPAAEQRGEVTKLGGYVRKAHDLYNTLLGGRKTAEAAEKRAADAATERPVKEEEDFLQAGAKKKKKWGRSTHGKIRVKSKDPKQVELRKKRLQENKLWLGVKTKAAPLNLQGALAEDISINPAKRGRVTGELIPAADLATTPMKPLAQRVKDFLEGSKRRLAAGSKPFKVDKKAEIAEARDQSGLPSAYVEKLSPEELAALPQRKPGQQIALPPPAKRIAPTQEEPLTTVEPPARRETAAARTARRKAEVEEALAEGKTGYTPRKSVVATSPEIEDAKKAKKDSITTQIKVALAKKKARRAEEAKNKKLLAAAEKPVFIGPTRAGAMKDLPPAADPQGHRLEAKEEVRKALGEAPKVDLTTAEWTPAKGLEGHTKGSKTRVLDKIYETDAYTGRLREHMNSASPHETFGGLLEADLRATTALMGHLKTWVLGSKATRFDEKSIDRFKFTLEGKEQVKRLWRISQESVEKLRARGFDLEAYGNLKKPAQRVLFFGDLTRGAMIDANTVASKYFGPEDFTKDVKGQPTQRRTAYLRQLATGKKGKSLMATLGEVVRSKRERNFVSPELLEADKPSPFVERKGPFGSTKETRDYHQEWLDHESTKVNEPLLPLDNAIARTGKLLGVELTSEEVAYLKENSTSPAGTGRRKRYSSIEQAKLLDEQFGKDLVNRLGEEGRTRLAETLKYELTGNRATTQLRPSSRGDMQYPSIYGDTEGVPFTLNPETPNQPTIRTGKARRGVNKGQGIDESKEASVGFDIKPDPKFRVSKQSKEGKSGVVGFHGEINRPFYKGNRLLSLAETKLEKDRAARQVLARSQSIKGDQQYRKGKRLHVEANMKDFDTLVDGVVTSAGVKKGRNSIGRLWTKEALYAEQVMQNGPEWKKSHPLESFRPEQYMDPLSEKMEQFIGEQMEVASNERSAQLEGEYYYDKENLAKLRRDEVAKLEADYDREHLESREKFEEERMKALERRSEDEQAQEAQDLPILPSSKKFIESVGGVKKLFQDDISKVRKWVETHTELGDIAKSDKGAVLDYILEEGRAARQEKQNKASRPVPSTREGKMKELPGLVDRAKQEAIDQYDRWEKNQLEFEQKDSPSGEDFMQAGAKRKRKRPAYDPTGNATHDRMAKYFNSTEYQRSRRWATASQKENWKRMQWIGEVLNVTRPLKTMADVSAVFRNTFMLSTDQLAQDVWRRAKDPLGRRKVNTSLRRNIVDMLKTFASEDGYKKLNDDLEASPYFRMAKDMGVRLIDADAPAEGFIGKEHLYKALDMVPVVGKGLKWVAKGSERSYNWYSNKVMVDATKYGMDFLEKGGLFDMEGRTKAGMDDYTNAKYVHDSMDSLRDHINKAAGRKELTKDPKLNKFANYVLYSGQLNWSRLNMLGEVLTPSIKDKALGFGNMPTKEIRTYARHQVLRSLAGGMAGVAFVGALAKLAGEDPEVELDPRSTDFMKVRFGPIAFDGWGGIQQWLRAGAQVATGKRKEISSGKVVEQKPTDTVMKFVRSKMGPGAQLVLDVAMKRTAQGEAFDLEKDPTGFAKTLAMNMLMPMSIEDIGGIMRENPKLGFLVPLMLLGHGVSTSRGAKERWLGSNPFDPKVREAHRKTTLLEKELRAQGVNGPKLSHKVTLPGKDILGRRNYYNMTPGEVAQFEGEYMPMITDLLVEAIESDAYRKLPREKRPAALQRLVHRLNERYGAARKLKSKYRGLYNAGKVKPSGIVGEEVKDLAFDLEEERSGKVDR